MDHSNSEVQGLRLTEHVNCNSVYGYNTFDLDSLQTRLDEILQLQDTDRQFQIYTGPEGLRQFREAVQKLENSTPVKTFTEDEIIERIIFKQNEETIENESTRR